jgi:hypothetical protein
MCHPHHTCDFTDWGLTARGGRVLGLSTLTWSFVSESHGDMAPLPLSFPFHGEMSHF